MAKRVARLASFPLKFQEGKWGAADNRLLNRLLNK